MPQPECVVVTVSHASSLYCSGYGQPESSGHNVQATSFTSLATTTTTGSLSAAATPYFLGRNS
eukprot:2277265-Rhodomonas_salina.1